MRGLTCVPGISCGGDEAQRGYAQPVVDGVGALGRVMLGPLYEVDVKAAYWATVAQALWGEQRLPSVLGVAEDYLADVWTYLTNPAPIKARVRAELERCGRGRIVLAHSLGSVVCLDLLLDELERGLVGGPLAGPMDEWLMAGLVTIGSPLGIKLGDALSIIDGIMPDVVAAAFTNRAARALTLPAPPASWQWSNLADPDDLVSGGLTRRTTDLEALPGFRRLRVEQRPDISTGGILSAHAGMWSDAVVHHECFDMISGAV